MNKPSSRPLENTVLHVRFNGESHFGNCDLQRTLLENIEAMGLPIRSACRRGLCGSCKVLIEAGALHPTRHIYDGDYILSCSSLLTGNTTVIVKYPHKDPL